VANTSGHAISALPFAGNRSRRTGAGRRITSEIARYLGAASILVVGGIHAQQYYDAYFSYVPTIGTLFLLSFIGAGSQGGERTIERPLSVDQTCRLQRRSLFAYLSDVLIAKARGDPVPTLA
jgi:hypothetical protein